MILIVVCFTVGVSGIILSEGSEGVPKNTSIGCRPELSKKTRSFH